MTAYLDTASTWSQGNGIWKKNYQGVWIRLSSETVDSRKFRK